MELNEEELKYKQIILSLNQLQKIKAPDNFEIELFRKINSPGSEKEKETFWEKFLIPSKLIPSAALAAAAVILFFLLNTGSGEFENPLLISPRIREDVAVSSVQVRQAPIAEVKNNIEKKEETRDQIKVDEEKKESFASDLKIPKPKGMDKKPSDNITAPEPLGFTTLDSINPLEKHTWKDDDSFFTQNVKVTEGYPIMTGASGENYQITKSGLNFRQVNIVEEEREQIIHLREKLKTLMNQTGKALKIK